MRRNSTALVSLWMPRNPATSDMPVGRVTGVPLSFTVRVGVDDLDLEQLPLARARERRAYDLGIEDRLVLPNHKRPATLAPVPTSPPSASSR